MFVIEPQPNSSFKSLQPQIRQITGVRPDDQVLLIAGGEALDTEKCVRDCSGLGTQSNPVFLFQRCNRKERDDVNYDQDVGELTHILDDAIDQSRRLESSTDVRAVYIELPERARQCREAGQKSVTLCARIVQEHQLLHQGWVALVTNMDASVARLKRRANRHKANLEKVRQQNEKATLILKDFDVCLDQLKRIIIPASVIAHSRLTKDLTNVQDMSLYDWISQYDPECSLQELVDSVKEQFRLYGESDENKISVIFDALFDQSRKEFREIKGINKRLMQLDSNLVTMDGYNKTIAELLRGITQSTPLTDGYAIQERVNEHRIQLSEICEKLLEIRKVSGLFYHSKNELLTNLRQRLSGWTVSTYEMIHHCHNEIMVFEEKFNGLRQRLELIRQIKETPVLYLTAVCEVVRRNALNKEFTAWHKQHVDRCTAFFKDEEETRSQISHKLERHFLRVLFSGIFDTFPDFFVKNLGVYDKEMPPVSADYVRQLRQEVKDLEHFLKITSPQVFAKLSVRDIAMSSPQGPFMRREESFFTPDAVNNIATLSRNFPSTNWLGGLDGFDNSPSMQPTISMGNSPPSRTGSATSMNIPVAPSLNQLSMLDEHAEGSVPSSLIAKSAPINIPAAPTREVSEKSSQFSTPDDHFNNDNESSGELHDDGSSLQQFPVDDLTTRSQQSLEFLKSVLTDVAQLSKDLLDVRAEVVNRRDQFDTDFKKMDEYSQQILATKTQEMENALAAVRKEKEDMEKELKTKLEEAETNLSETQSKLEDMTAKNTQLNTEMDELHNQIKIMQEEAETFESKLRETERDMFKKLTIEYELQSEKMRCDYEDTIEQKDAEIRNMKKEMEKKIQEIEMLRADPESESYRKTVAADVRGDLEKEFKSKTELITKGMMQQRDDAVARNKKEFDFELKKANHQYVVNTKFLAMERDLLKEVVQKNTSGWEEICNSIENDVKQRLEQEEGKPVAIYARSVGVQTEVEEVAMPNLSHVSSFYGPSPPMMSESQYPDMLQSTFQLAPPQEDTSNKESHEIHKSEGNLIECAVQTRIALRAMDLMVAVQDIGEGATVLVIWSERHSAYILFSSSSYLHFVKESSVRRLGLSTLEGSRRNWIFGRVLHLDLCMIRKPTNRYNLPVDTRVYRVDVDAVPMEARNIRD